MYVKKLNFTSIKNKIKVKIEYIKRNNPHLIGYKLTSNMYQTYEGSYDLVAFIIGSTCHVPDDQAKAPLLTCDIV